MKMNETETASAIVAAFFGRRVDEVIPVLNKGSVNRIFFVRSAGAEVVVRMSQPEDKTSAGLFYEKEAWCLQQAANLGIPSPTVLKVGYWGTRPYMLETRVPGVNGEDCGLDETVLWQTLGHYARLVHSIALDGFGETLPDFYRCDAQAAWLRFVDYNLDSLTDADELRRLQVYTTVHTDAIRLIFHGLRGTSFRFGLNHGDLSIRNTVVDEAGQISLVDWGSAEAHIVPHYDLIEILRWNPPASANFCAFLAGYGMSDSEFSRLLPELEGLTLLKAFDLTRWAIDRCPERITEIAERARQTVQRILN